MKNLLAPFVLLLVLAFPSCDNVPEPTPEEAAQALLSAKTWHMQSVKVDGVDRSPLFTGMTMTFGNGTFSTTNGGPVWPASGTFTFTAGATTIQRNDGIDVAVNVSTSGLELTMDWDKTTYGPGRVKSVEGTHVFTFN